MAEYYDYVLGIIPASMVAVTALLLVAGLGVTTAVPLGAGTSAVVVGHALFVNGPTSVPTEPSPAPSADASPTPSYNGAGAD